MSQDSLEIPSTSITDHVLKGLYYSVITPNRLVLDFLFVWWDFCCFVVDVFAVLGAFVSLGFFWEHKNEGKLLVFTY